MPTPETIAIPGAIDLHVHLRQPSLNQAETIESGTRAAYRGGFVLIADMPNNPGHETWTEDRILEKHQLIRENAFIPVATYAGSQPDHDNIGQLASMAPHAIGLKLYGAPTTGNDRDFTAEAFRPIVNEWHRVAPDKPIMLHAGKDNLEEMIRLVADESDHHLHVCHVNDPHEIEVIEDAKAAELSVSCGVCPHHLFKTSHDVVTQGWFARMQPPLATQIDSEKLFEQFANGDIDVLETDHAPHFAGNKWKAERENPQGIHDPVHTTCFGVPGIEFALPLLFYQVKRQRLSLERVIEATSTKPAEILGVHTSLSTAVIWAMEEYRIDDEENQTAGGSGWTPYLGMLAVGRVSESLVELHRVVSQRGEVI